jgi:hypothetical protein
MKDKLVPASARIDLRDLATIFLWFKSKGILPNNKSELIHYSLSALSEMIQKEGGDRFETIEEALLVLQENGISVSTSRATRTGKALLGALTLEKFGDITHTKTKATLEEDFDAALEEYAEKIRRET